MATGAGLNFLMITASTSLAAAMLLRGRQAVLSVGPGVLSGVLHVETHVKSSCAAHDHRVIKLIYIFGSCDGLLLRIEKSLTIRSLWPRIGFDVVPSKGHFAPHASAIEPGVRLVTLLGSRSWTENALLYDTNVVCDAVAAAREVAGGLNVRLKIQVGGEDRLSIEYAFPLELVLGLKAESSGALGMDVEPDEAADVQVVGPITEIDRRRGVREIAVSMLEYGV